MSFHWPFPFVVGCGRSGTTLLRAMLDAHSELAIPGESHFLTEVIENRRRYDGDGGFATERFVADLVESERFLLWGLPPDDLQCALASSEALDLAGAIRVLYDLYAERHGKQRYGDKTPNHVLNIPLLTDLLPEACFVHLIRDGRDVALSLIEVPHWGPTDVGTAALRWRQFVEAGREGARQIEPGRYIELRYEELVLSPEEPLRRVCDLVGLRFEPAMLRYHEHLDSLLPTISSPHIHERLRLPLTEGLRDWRTQMTPEDQAAFESVAGDLLEELGYERARP